MCFSHGILGYCEHTTPIPHLVSSILFKFWRFQ